MFNSLSEQVKERNKMIDTEKYSIDALRDRMPFRVPDGYFEDFTEDFMCHLPKKTASEAKVISFYDRIKPWLFLAAMFVGIIVLFKVFNKTSDISREANSGILSSIIVEIEETEDADFLEYIEELYGNKYAVTYVFDYYLID